MIEMRVRWIELGAHVHMRVFVGDGAGYTGAMAGTMIVRSEEWPTIREILEVGGAVLVSDAEVKGGA